MSRIICCRLSVTIFDFFHTYIWFYGTAVILCSLVHLIFLAPLIISIISSCLALYQKSWTIFSQGVIHTAWPHILTSFNPSLSLSMPVHRLLNSPLPLSARTLSWKTIKSCKKYEKNKSSLKKIFLVCLFIFQSLTMEANDRITFKSPLLIWRNCTEKYVHWKLNPFPPLPTFFHVVANPLPPLRCRQSLWMPLLHGTDVLQPTFELAAAVSFIYAIGTRKDVAFTFITFVISDAS